MCSIVSFLCILGSFALTNLAQGDQDELVFMYADNEPYIIDSEDGLTGFLADYIREISQEARITARFQHVPWVQQLPTLQANKPNTCALTLFKTPERLKYIQFSAPVGSEGYFVLIGLRNNGKLARHSTFSEVARNPALQPVLQKNTFYNDYIEALLSDKGVAATAGSIEHLISTQVNSMDRYFIMSDIRAYRLFEKEDFFSKYTAYSHFTDLMQENFHHIGCSKATDTHLIERLNAAIELNGLALPQ